MIILSMILIVVGLEFLRDSCLWGNSNRDRTIDFALGAILLLLGALSLKF